MEIDPQRLIGIEPLPMNIFATKRSNCHLLFDVSLCRSNDISCMMKPVSETEHCQWPSLARFGAMRQSELRRRLAAGQFCLEDDAQSISTMLLDAISSTKMRSWRSAQSCFDHVSLVCGLQSFESPDHADLGDQTKSRKVDRPSSSSNRGLTRHLLFMNVFNRLAAVNAV